MTQTLCWHSKTPLRTQVREQNLAKDAPGCVPRAIPGRARLAQYRNQTLPTWRTVRKLLKNYLVREIAPSRTSLPHLDGLTSPTPFAHLSSRAGLKEGAVDRTRRKLLDAAEKLPRNSQLRERVVFSGLCTVVLRLSGWFSVTTRHERPARAIPALTRGGTGSKWVQASAGISATNAA